jgi:hypothetical protein
VSPHAWTVLLAAATCLHAGFQVTVTALVYPALVRVPAERWQEAHGRHSRAIAPVVAVVYGALLVSCAGALLSAPGVAVAAAVAGVALSLLVTATFAAPTHGRLSPGPEPALLRRLLVVDRVRCLGAVAAAAAGVVAALIR